MSEYAETELRTMDEVNETEVRNYRDKTIIVVSLYATHTEEDKKAVKDKAHSLGFYGGSPTSLYGSFALKFTRREN